jgi:hypothetical protein
MKSIHICHEDPDAPRAAEKLLEYTGVNVGTVGHVDWGRRGYQPDLSQLSSNAPWTIFVSNRPRGLEYQRLHGLWLQYIDEISKGRSDAEAIQSVFGSRSKLDTPYLDFQDGGLIVASRVIWILPDEQYAKFHKHAADWTMPSKDYVRSVVNQYYILKDFQEKHNPIVAHVQGVDIRKNDVANGWGAYAGKLMIPEYTRNADGSYLIDEQGNKVPTGRMVEGIKIDVSALTIQEHQK